MTTKRISDKGGGIITTIVAGACLWLASATIPIGAAIMDVTTTTDEVTVNTFCSLREAIINANDNAQTNVDCPAGEAAVADIINVPAGLYTLTITGVDENPTAGQPWEAVINSDASMGDLDITDDVTITGAGPGNDPATSTIVQWGSSPPGFAVTPTNLNPTLDGRNDRIFHIRAVDANIGNVTLSGMTLLNGDVGLIPTSATDVCVFDDINQLWVYDTNLENAYDLSHTGSCIDASDPNQVPDLVITQFRRWGGAIAIGAGAAVVDYEQAIHGPGGGGGGGEGKKPPVLPPPEDEDAVSVESVTYDQLVIVSNWAGADAGGIFNIADGTISQSAISGNFSGGNGGGIYNDADLTISDSLIGKVFDAATLALYPELANGNQGENGGGMFYTGVGTINVIRSAFNGNNGIGGGAIAGRAMGVLSIVNSTVSSNTGFDVGGGITTNGTVSLRNATVTENEATTDAPGGGAGLNAFGPGNYIFINTILADNWIVGGAEGEAEPRLANCGCSGGSAACATGIMVSQGYNLEDGDTCDLGLTGDQLNTNPLLGDLALNGGLTENHSLPHTYVGDPVDSPAVDTGDNTTCTNNDQRGSIRPADGDGDGTADCDIGAFELSVLSTDLQIANMVAPDEVFKTDNYTVTVTVLNNTGADDTNVRLTFDTLPAGVTYVSATSSVGICSEASGDVSCSIGTLVGGSSATVVLTLTADAVGDVTIAANVSSDTEDGTEPNNSASVNTAIIGIADLALTATANATSVVVGNQVTLTFTVANLDDPLSDVDGDLATEVRLYGTIPPEATLISATPDNGTTCTQTGADVVCALGDLAVAGPAINVVVVLRADEAGRVADVSASADAKQRDPDESNNTITASVTITSAPTGGGSSGGLCSYDPNGRFDPVLPLLVMLSLIYLARRRRVATQ